MRRAVRSGPVARARRRSQRDHEDEEQDLGDAHGACGDAAVEIALAQARRDHLVDDAPRYHVAQRTLDAVSDFDAHGAVVLGHQEQRAVVHLATAELPLLYHPQGVLLDGFGPRRADHQHGDLHALALLEGPKLRIQRGDPTGGERPGLHLALDDGLIEDVREDVGRHNAMDNLFAPELGGPVLHRFVLEKPKLEDEEALMHFVGYNAFDEPVSLWTYRESVTVLHEVGAGEPPAVDITLDDIDVAEQHRSAPEQDADSK